MNNQPPHPRDSREVPQMHQRSLHHDYHGRGIYLITLCTEGRQPLLGKLVGDSLAEAAIEPTALGREVLRCWEQIPSLQRQLAEQKTAKTGKSYVRDITLIDWQLMPDHFHGILFVRQEMDIALGDVIRGFMVGCTQAFNKLCPQICGTPNRTSSNTQNPTTPKTPNQTTSSTPDQTTPNTPNQTAPSTPLQPAESSTPPQNPAKNSTPQQLVGCSAYSRGCGDDTNRSQSAGNSDNSCSRPLWEKGYHDRLLFHDGQLQNMIDYVRDNPRRLMLRRQHRDLFIVQRNVRFARWCFSAIGQVRLLDAPMMAVHVRRYFSDEQRRSYMNSCILAARRGTVLVSPFISDYEKQVRDEAFREGLFCIQLCAEPFSDYHKPPGELIEHCSSGHLLMLTLTEGTTTERRITRDECNSLNAVAESMARESIEKEDPPPTPPCNGGEKLAHRINIQQNNNE